MWDEGDEKTPIHKGERHCVDEWESFETTRWSGPYGGISGGGCGITFHPSKNTTTAVSAALLSPTHATLAEGSFLAFPDKNQQGREEPVKVFVSSVGPP